MPIKRGYFWHVCAAVCADSAATSTSPSKSSVAPWGSLKTECRMQRHRPQVSIPEAGASPRSFQYWRESMREASGILASPERLQQSRRTPTESLCGRGDARGEVRRVLHQIHFNCSMTVPSEIVGRPTLVFAGILGDPLPCCPSALLGTSLVLVDRDREPSHEGIA